MDYRSNDRLKELAVS